MSEQHEAPLRVAGLILAAGESTRMGRPKALLPMPPAVPGDPESVTFGRHLIGVFRDGGCDPVMVVLGHEAREIRSGLVSAGDRGVEIIINSEYQRGMLSSIQAGIRRLIDATCDGVMVCPVDHPSISPPLVAAMVRAFQASRAPVILPLHKGRRGHPVLFSRACFAELLETSDDVGARQVVWDHGPDVLELDVDVPAVLEDVDTPELYELFRRRTLSDATPPTTLCEEEL